MLCAIEKGAPWPTAANAARTAFISKGEDDCDPKGFRGLAILSVIHRIWGVATLRQTAPWIQTWESEDL